MIFPEYKNLDLSKISKEVLSYWEENDILKKSIQNSSKRKPFVFFEGPPSAKWPSRNSSCVG